MTRLLRLVKERRAQQRKEAARQPSEQLKAQVDVQSKYGGGACSTTRSDLQQIELFGGVSIVCGCGTLLPRLTLLNPSIKLDARLDRIAEPIVKTLEAGKVPAPADVLKCFALIEGEFRKHVPIDQGSLSWVATADRRPEVAPGQLRITEEDIAAAQEMAIVRAVPSLPPLPAAVT